jgi:hypothetical protein
MHGQTDEAMACMNLKILDPDGPTRQEEEEEKKTPKKKSPKSSPASPPAPRRGAGEVAGYENTASGVLLRFRGGASPPLERGPGVIAPGIEPTPSRRGAWVIRGGIARALIEDRRL